MYELIIFALALALDLLLGEPPRPLHPVVWVGKVIDFLERIAPRQGNQAVGQSKQSSLRAVGSGPSEPETVLPRSEIIQFLYGAFAVIFSLALFTVPIYFFLAYLKSLNPVLFIAAGAYLLKSTFSLKGLARSANIIRRLLGEEKIEEARSKMRSLVSRDVSRLGYPLLVAAAIESVAENTNDSFIAPLFYFLVLGIPGALFYRIVNTWDAMVGYHGRYEYLGKFAARLDDVLNYIPARLTGILIVLGAFFTKQDGKSAWKIMFRDHGRTESPNAGWPMSAAAGALGVRLEKVGHYVLGDACQPLTVDKIDRSLGLLKASGALWASIVFVAGGFRFGFVS